LGYFGSFSDTQTNPKKLHQQGTLSGWLWWIRIVFGKNTTPQADRMATPINTPSSIPRSSASTQVAYWWDLVFASKESADEFTESIRASRANGLTIKFVVGDD
jgi:hypothetical protein